MPSPPSSEPTWIDTRGALEKACERWSGSSVLAVDTEFVRERTFFPQLGLLQVADHHGAALVDPLVIEDLEPLAEILADEEILKVAHSCSEDMEVLYHRFGDFPRPLFDTQVAAGIAGLEPSMSYQRLVAELLDVDLDKLETRSAWLRRPLSSDQLAYAAEDVEYLLPLHATLDERLDEMGRRDWVIEESSRLEDSDRFLPATEDAYLRIKGIGSLDRLQLAVAQRIAAWREREARRRDLPRGFVVPDKAILAVARALPSSPRQLSSLSDVPPRAAGRYGGVLLSAVREVRGTDPADRPPRVPRLPRSRTFKEVAKRLRGLVAETAEAMGVSRPVLASRREQRDLLLAARDGGIDPPPPPFDGWRWEVLEEKVKPLLREAASV